MWLILLTTFALAFVNFFGDRSKNLGILAAIGLAVCCIIMLIHTLDDKVLWVSLCWFGLCIYALIVLFTRALK